MEANIEQTVGAKRRLDAGGRYALEISYSLESEKGRPKGQTAKWRIFVDGKRQGSIKSEFFSAGDVVTVELERRHGQDGVMRVRVAGKAFVRDMTALPRDGMLYPAVRLDGKKQSYTMVAAP